MIIANEFQLGQCQADGCLTLKSENGLFSEVIHDVGTGVLTLGMSSMPKVRSTVIQSNKTTNKSSDQKGLWLNIETSSVASPYKVSYIFDMTRNNVNLGCVRDKNHQKLYPPNKFRHLDNGGFVKLSNTGKLEIYDNEHKIQRMAADFTGNYKSEDTSSIIDCIINNGGAIS